MLRFARLLLTVFLLASMPGSVASGSQPDDGRVRIWIERDQTFEIGKDQLSDDLARRLQGRVSVDSRLILVQTARDAQIGVHVGSGSHNINQMIWMGPVTYTYRPGGPRTLLGTHLVAAVPLGPIPDVLPSSSSPTFSAGVTVAESTLSLINSALSEAQRTKADPVETIRRILRGPA